MSVDALTVERWVGEAIIKCCYIVLSARIYRCSRTLPARSRSNWFKLEVEEVDEASAELARYRQDVSQPLIIQILYAEDDSAPSQAQIIEQWEMQFDGIPPTRHPRNFSYDDEPTKIYKRMCVMARTLYSYVRVLPAYRLYRACRDSRGASHNLTYRLLHSNAPAFLPAPSSRQQMERFAFAPIETTTGSLQISVQYQANVVPVITTAVPRPVSIPQHVITNYIRAGGQREPAITRTLSASAAPILSGAAAAAAGAVGSATAAGLSLLSRACRGQGDARPSSDSPSTHVPVLAPHAEEAEDGTEDQQPPDDRQRTAPATQPRAIAPARAAHGRSQPMLVPGMPMQPSSAPCDSRLARNPSPACSPYTLHLAHHGKSQQHLPLPSPQDLWAGLQPVPRALPDPHQAVPGAAFRGSGGSSGTSCASPLATSPAAPCRALVKHPTSRAHSTARPMGIAVDASFESRRLLSSPEGILRSSSGRSDVFSSRGWSPAAATAEWGGLPHRQRLLQHPDGADQGSGTVDGRHARFEAGDSGARPAGLSREWRSGRLRSHAHTVHDLAASAPLFPQGGAVGDREADIKDFLLQLEAPVHFSGACSQEHCKTLLDVQAAAEEIMARWGMS
eukprot:jgi/Ulvmu1/5058/UM021_0075.1